MKFYVDTSPPLAGRVLGHPEEVCRRGHEACADSPGGACSLDPALVYNLSDLADDCRCGGEFRAVGADDDAYLFECERCRRRVWAR